MTRMQEDLITALEVMGVLVLLGVDRNFESFETFWVISLLSVSVGAIFWTGLMLRVESRAASSAPKL